MRPPGQGSYILGAAGDGEGAAWGERGLWEAVSQGVRCPHQAEGSLSPASTRGSQSHGVPRAVTA